MAEFKEFNYDGFSKAAKFLETKKGEVRVISHVGLHAEDDVSYLVYKGYNDVVSFSKKGKVDPESTDAVITLNARSEEEAANLLSEELHNAFDKDTLRCETIASLYGDALLNKPCLERYKTILVEFSAETNPNDVLASFKAIAEYVEEERNIEIRYAAIVSDYDIYFIIDSNGLEFEFLSDEFTRLINKKLIDDFKGHYISAMLRDDDLVPFPSDVEYQFVLRGEEAKFVEEDTEEEKEEKEEKTSLDGEK